MIRELAEAIHSAERKAVEGGYVLADELGGLDQGGGGGAGLLDR